LPSPDQRCSSQPREQLRLGKALGVSDRDILAAAVAVMDQPAAMNWPPVVQSLLQGIKNEAGMRGPADPPANDIAGVEPDPKLS